jgi:diaminopimelate decarboxylase
MYLISEVARQKGKRARVALRVNPDVDPETHPYISTGLKQNKFGLSIDQAVEAYREASRIDSLEVIGIDCHIGSQILKTSPFVDASGHIKGLLNRLTELGIHLSFIDMGGGLGISYRDEEPPGPRQYVKAVLQQFEGLGKTIIIEPGRSIAGNAGVLVTRLLFSKDNTYKHFYIVDAAMNDLGRPSLYNAYHEILPLEQHEDADSVVVDVVGPICETGDFLAKDRRLPILSSGSMLAVMSAGAYGFTMSSNYNSRPRAAEVLVRGSRYEIVRKRETYDDLVRGEVVTALDGSGI